MPYNRIEIPPFTQADAEDVNRELTKIQAAIAAIEELQQGSGSPRFTWTAYADSADGTSNFTTGSPGNRTYIGQAFNQATATESNFPEDYVWTKLRGEDGANGDYFETLWIRQWAPPATPSDAEPAGYTPYPPSGDERLWFITAKKNSDGALLTAWSNPVSPSGFMVRGAYAAGTTYYFDDGSTFGGGVYRMKLPSSTGNAPSGTAEANAWWDVYSAPGSPGEPGTPPGDYSDTINLTSSSTGVNLRTLADAEGYTGHSNAEIDFVVPNGVTITGFPGGGHAIDVGSWPAGYTIALTLTVQSGGIVQGGGGRGGDGGSYGADGTPGGRGGDAIYCQNDITITIDAGGIVRAAGAGGAGGDGVATGFPEPVFKGGGGGGGGAPNGPLGLGGDGNTPGANGNNGTTGGGGAAGAGASGASNGGAGGNFATGGSSSSGQLGGQPGYAVRKNGHTVPVTNNGTMTGTAA